MTSRRVELPAGIPVEVHLDDVERDGTSRLFIRVVPGGGHPGVAVLAVSDGRFLLVRSRRHAVGISLWEALRGFGEGSTPDDDARRELKEETGYDAADLYPLGIVHPDSGLLDSTVNLFLATIPVDAVPAERDGEVDEVRWFAVAEVYEMATRGDITDGFTLALLLRALPLLEQHGLDRHGP